MVQQRLRGLRKPLTWRFGGENGISTEMFRTSLHITIAENSHWTCLMARTIVQSVPGIYCKFPVESSG